MRAGGLSFVFLAAAAWLACGNNYEGPGSGERLGSCYANGTCNAGLECIDNVCVLHAEDAGTGEAGASSGGTSGGTSSSGTTGGTSSGGTSSGGTSSGGTSSGDVSVPASFVARDAALCAQAKKCNPNLYNANFASDADCATYYGAFEHDFSAYPGQAAPDQKAVDACTARIVTADCLTTLGRIAECNFKGAGAKNAACNFASQCSGGACEKLNPVDCGKCADAPVVLPKAKDSACDVADTCAAGTVCSGPIGAMTCTVPKEEGADCDAAKINDCNFAKGLTCKGAKCTRIAYGTAGEACGGGGDDPCGGLTNQCVGQAGAKACTANAKEGYDCANDFTKPYCAAGLTCDSAKCFKVKYAPVCK